MQDTLKIPFANQNISFFCPKRCIIIPGDEIMDEKIIKRINELAALAKTRALTDDEEKERAGLRAQYIAAFRDSLRSQLDNTYIVTPDGKKQKLHRKSEKE